MSLLRTGIFRTAAASFDHPVGAQQNRLRELDAEGARGLQVDHQLELVRLAETSVRRLPGGGITPHYDPNMVLRFTHYPRDYDQWEAYDAIDIPVLCLRGEASDLLLPETADEMRKRGPRAVVVTIPGCWHAPALNEPGQIGLVERFFAGGVD